MNTNSRATMSSDTVLIASIAMHSRMGAPAANLDRGEAQLAMVPISTEPPKIFVSRRPAILVLIDGEPVEAPIGELDLRFVVNTNWDLFVDPVDGRYYLLDEDGWLGASSLKSSWSRDSPQPESMLAAWRVPRARMC